MVLPLELARIALANSVTLLRWVSSWGRAGAVGAAGELRISARGHAGRPGNPRNAGLLTRNRVMVTLGVMLLRISHFFLFLPH